MAVRVLFPFLFFSFPFLGFCFCRSYLYVYKRSGGTLFDGSLLCNLLLLGAYAKVTLRSSWWWYPSSAAENPNKRVLDLMVWCFSRVVKSCLLFIFFFSVT